MSYTDEQQASLIIAKRRHLQNGRPQVVAKINLLLSEDAPYADIWRIASSDVREMVKPEKPAEVFEAPPLTGKGSTTAAWQEFALKVSDMDEEVIYSMTRTDLVSVLVDRGIIEDPASKPAEF